MNIFGGLYQANFYQQLIRQKLGLIRIYLLSLYNQIVEKNYEKRNF